MKHKLVLLLLLFATTMMAKNTVTKTEQVNESVDVPENTDYTITGATPFGEMGSVNIVDIEHSVVIINAMKPSVAKGVLKNHVYINGSQAVDGSNCQVRMYGRGAIILPYSSTIKPLTCYSEDNFKGTEANNYTEGHSGGFMKTLNSLTLLNNIRSFKLKRGYMVTFAVGTAGWGYSRCFIADQEDLEIAVVPAPLHGKISSYRLFKWWNAHKAGIADSNDKNAISALKASWCYRMWPDPQGLDYRPDCEYIPHHYKEGYPGIADLGSKDFSCHLKNNNEPGNSADEAPCSVDDVLSAWPELMRTGMRLLSESSHDGSMGHLKDFITKIDERGWRCDILDLHCYWDGQWNSLDWYINEYGKNKQNNTYRPTWISEWVWGSSWGNNGAFASGRRNDNATYDGTVPLLEKINSNPKVERYAYWNSEQDFSKIYRGGSLTKLGNYYANMEVGQGYNASVNNYVPTIVYNAIGTLKGTYSENTRTGVKKMDFSWTDPNGDMLDSMVVMCKVDGESTYKKVADVKLKDKSSKSDVSYTYTYTFTELGNYSFIIRTYAGGKKISDSNVINKALMKSNVIGDIQFGSIIMTDKTSASVSFTTTETLPCVIAGFPTNKSFNGTSAICGQLKSIIQGKFEYAPMPWNYNANGSISQDIKQEERVDYILMEAGNYKVGKLDIEVGKVKGEKNENLGGTPIEIKFAKAFPEGVTPIVIIQPQNSSVAYGTMPKVYNVTNEGFTAVLERQTKETATFSLEETNYIAITPGKASIGEGMMIMANIGENTPLNRAVRVDFKNIDGTEYDIQDAYVLMGAQSRNNTLPDCMNITLYSTKKVEEENYLDYINVVRTVDNSATIPSGYATNKTYANNIGWIAICKDPDGGETSIRRTSTEGDYKIIIKNGKITIDGKKTNVRIFNTSGVRVNEGTTLSSGIYIVSDGTKSTKVRIK